MDTPLHILWNDVINLYNYVDEDPQFESLANYHKEFISSWCSAIEGHSENRTLDKFIGEDAVDAFFALLEENHIQLDRKYTINLNVLDDEKCEVVLDALHILLESELLDWRKQSRKNNDVPSGILERFLNGPQRRFFLPLFPFIDNLPYAWLKGIGNIGVRVVTPSNPSVSVCTMSAGGLLTFGIDNKPPQPR
jgi:hypothetical protein